MSVAPSPSKGEEDQIGAREREIKQEKKKARNNVAETFFYFIHFCGEHIGYRKSTMNKILVNVRYAIVEGNGASFGGKRVVKWLI